jgi:hypothetical protein
MLLAGCGASGPSSLDELPNKRVSLLVSFNPPAPQPPALAALLKFDDVRYCPPLDLAVDLDGVALESSPAATGADGTTCQLGFYLTAGAPATAAQSTVRFTHQSRSVSATFTRLLEPRNWMTTVAGGSNARAGDTIDFVWSTETDGIDLVEGFFVMGDDKQQVVPQLMNNTARITVPSLALGPWTLNVGAIVHAAVVDCVGAVSCSSQIGRQNELDLAIQ